MNQAILARVTKLSDPSPAMVSCSMGYYQRIYTSYCRTGCGFANQSISSGFPFSDDKCSSFSNGISKSKYRSNNVCETGKYIKTNTNLTELFQAVYGPGLRKHFRGSTVNHSNDYTDQSVLGK